LNTNSETKPLHYREKVTLFPPEILICSRDFCTFGFNGKSPSFYKKNEKGEFIEDGFLCYSPFYISGKDSELEFKKFIKKQVKNFIDKYFDALFDTEIYLLPSNDKTAGECDS